MNLDVTDPNGTFDAVISQFDLKNDTALAKALGYSDSSTLSRARKNGRMTKPLVEKLTDYVQANGDEEVVEDEPTEVLPSTEDVDSQPQTQTLQLVDIAVLSGVQQRVVELNPQTVKEYIAAIEGADGTWPFPPVVVFENTAHDDPHTDFDRTTRFILADGFHRVQAGNHALGGWHSIPVEIRRGGMRDAILYACGCNAEHGLRRSIADKRNAVDTLLRDEEWSGRSDRWIAEAAHVSPTFVATRRAAMQGEPEPMVDDADVEDAEPETSTHDSARAPEEPRPTARTGRDGRTTNTAAIGTKPKERPDAAIRKFKDTISAALGALIPLENEITPTEALELCALCRDTLIRYRDHLKAADWEAMLEKLCQEGTDSE
jgi:hypothetical protein